MICARGGAEVVACFDSDGNYIMPEAILPAVAGKAKAKRFVYPRSRPEETSDIRSQAALTQEQRMQIASNRKQALERRKMKASAAENIEPNNQATNSEGNLEASKQPAASQVGLTEEQRLQIAANRAQALERKKMRASAARSKSNNQASAAILVEDQIKASLRFPSHSHFRWQALEQKYMNTSTARSEPNNQASAAAIHAEDQVSVVGGSSHAGETHPLSNGILAENAKAKSLLACHGFQSPLPLPYEEESEEWEAIALQATQIVENYSNSRASSPTRSTATIADTSRSREEHSRTPPPRQKRQLYAQTTPVQLPARSRRQACQLPCLPYVLALCSDNSCPTPSSKPETGVSSSMSC